MAVPLAAIGAVSGAVSAVSGIAGAISGTSDAAKRRTYEQNLGLLNLDQKRKLEGLLQEAGSEQARQQILAQTLGTANTARIDALAKIQVEREKTKKTLLVVGIIGGVIVLGGLLFILAKRKN